MTFGLQCLLKTMQDSSLSLTDLANYILVFYMKPYFSLHVAPTASSKIFCFNMQLIGILYTEYEAQDF